MSDSKNVQHQKLVNTTSNESLVCSSNKSQNVQLIKRSKSFSTFNNTLFTAPQKRLNLGFSNSMSIICYFDDSQASEVNKILLINDANLNNSIKAEEINFLDLSKHSPIPHFTKEDLYKFEEEEDNPRQKNNKHNKELFYDKSETPSVSDDFKNDEYSEEENKEEYRIEKSNNNKSKSKDEIKCETENKDEKENLFSKTSIILKKEINILEELIGKMPEEEIYQMILTVENELKVFNMTCIKGPLYEDEMTVIHPENMNCEIIDTICPEAFEEFRFGNCVYYSDDISPDELHINAWHELGIDPDHMAICLGKFFQQNINGKNDIRNLHCVLHYILKWVQFYPDDFARSPECARHTGKVLSQITEKNSDISYGPVLINALIKVISQGSKSFATVQYPLPEVEEIFSPKCLKTSFYDDILKYKRDIDLLVQHLTYIDISMLRKVLRSEIVQLNFKNEDKKRFLSPNVLKITERFNIIARFVSYSILSVARNHSKKLENKCKRRIEFWISVMKKAREIKNFCLLYEINAGLLNPSIQRLKNVWYSISKSQRDEFNKLHEITEPVDNNVKKYFELVLEDPKKTVPYLGPFFDKIIRKHEYYKNSKMTIQKNKNNDGSKDGNKSAKVSGYNMAYQYDLYKKSSLIFLNWGADYKFQLDYNFLQICQNIPSVSDEKLRELSDQILPKNIL